MTETANQTRKKRPLLVRIFINTSLVLISLMIGLILAEIVSRRFIPFAAPEEKRQNVFLIQPAPNPDMTYQIRPNSDFISFGVTYRTNEYGFRDDPIKEKTGNMFRIVCVGDSVTFGTGVAIPDTFPNQMERILQQHAKAGVQFDVINAGVSAFNIRNSRGLMDAWLAELKPDLVVYTFVKNDLDTSSSAGPDGWMIEYDPLLPPDAPFVTDEFPLHWFTRKIFATKGMNQSALVHLIEMKLAGLKTVTSPLLVGDFPETEKRWAAWQNELEKMKSITTGLGVPFLVYAYGYRNFSEPIDARISTICNQLSLPFISTRSIFDMNSYMEEHSLGFDSHCNEEGCLHMAERLIAGLLDNHLLDIEQIPGWKAPQTYEEILDPQVIAKLTQASLDAPSQIGLQQPRGVMGLIGGVDFMGRMARSGIFRLGGKGKQIEVEVAGILTSATQPQTLSARINGVTVGETVEIPKWFVWKKFPIPEAFWEKTIELELVAGGPVWIPTLQERFKGAKPQTLGIRQIRRVD